MEIIVLGAAAGGGFPQWNCNCPGCRASRLDSAKAVPRTQASIALSADGAHWAILNASPDLPFQLRAIARLHPRHGIRHSPIAAVVISGGDVDCIAGLLSLRESQPFALYAGSYVQRVLRENPIFGVLDPALVPVRPLAPALPSELRDTSGAALGLSLEAFAVPGKIPLYHETGGDPARFASRDAVIGLEIAAAGRRVLYIPGCAAVTDDIRARAERADILFFDGTLWQDDEMIRTGTGAKTGSRMGHMSISGAQGSIAAFAGSAARRKVFIHINNTNPILCEDSEQAARVRAAGWQIAHDGMAITL